jgi:sulfide:quinone oxidoreductase
MAHIVILGAGIGGAPAAYELRAALGNEHKITVVNAVDYFQFVPSNPWLAVGWRDREAITVPLAPALKKRGIDFIGQPVTRIAPDENRLELKDGGTLDYDYLIITTGPKLAFDEVPGAGPLGHTQSICTVDHAETARAAYDRFLQAPGPAIIGALPGASCFGPAYEFAYILSTDLQKRKLRHKVPMTYVTPEPYIGHLGLAGVGDSKSLLESELRNRDIRWITNAKVTRVEAGKMFVTEMDEHGQVKKEHELPFAYSMMLPAFRGVDPVAAVEGLCNPRGFVLVDQHQRSPKWRNIFSAGVCIAIPPVEATPVGTGVPKTGYMIETMVTAIVKNIQADLAGREASARGSWSAICLADMGNTGAAFVALPQIPPRNVNWFKTGKWVHLAKIAFEKYFLYKLRNGSSEPVYEKYVLKLMGIERLERPPANTP